MKNFKWICLMAMSMASVIGSARAAWGDAGNGTYINPVIKADFSDPDVIRVGDKYYMVASDFHFMGMQVLESDDLVNWQYISQVYDRLPFAAYDTNSRYGGGSWAPALRYHDGEYYVYFCTPHEGLFMSKAADARGPWSEPVCIKAVEKWEDPCPLWDDDGQAYLGHSLYGAGPIIIHKMSNDGTRLLDDGVEVYRGPVAEGTKMHKINGMYYMSIPEGGVKGGWQTILRSNSIYGPYERRVVLHQGTTDINGPHQGAIVEGDDGRWWFYHFQETDALGRVVHLQPMSWSDDGWPVIGADIDGDGIGEPVPSWSLPRPGGRPSGLASSDEFSTTALSPHWQWNHNPVDSAWSLEAPYGQLTLRALKARDFRSARNTLTQKAVGNSCRYTTAMLVDDMADGQRCGLACMGKTNHMMGVVMDKGCRYLYTGTDTTEQRIAEINGINTPVYLRLDLDFANRAYRWSYSLDGKDFTPVSPDFYVRWGNWKGVRPALYSYNTVDDAGCARYMWFEGSSDGNPAPPTAGTAAFDHDAEEAIIRSIATTVFPSLTIEVTAGGDARQAIQRAIDECSLTGGGTVNIADGLYNISGSIVLKSNVNLHLSDGAVLRFSGRADDFLPEVFTRWEGTELYGHSPMIYAHNAVNIAITGRGTIDAQAGVEMGAWAEREQADQERLRAQGEALDPVESRIYGRGTVLRPTCIEMIGCSRVLIEDVTVVNSAFWTIHPVYCDNVIVRGVTIDSHFANNDGCDPDSSSNILIEHCNFNVGDDAIAIKSGRDADGRRVGRPSENIVIRDCVFNSECNGLCIGSEMSGGVQGVYMHDIRIGTVKNAIYFKSNRDRGGYIRNVHVSDITVEHTLGAVLRFETNYFGFRGGSHASQYEDFHISNVHAKTSDHYALFISGYPEKPVRNVVVENMSVDHAPEPCYLHCTEGVELINVRVNGELLPTTPADDPVDRTIPIY